MNNLNYIFFEEFKKLEKLCGEMYGSHNGVTNYIDDMKDVPYSNYRDIPNWEDDLSQLKKMRHIRNNLAHEEGAFAKKVCTQNDIRWIQTFIKRIMNQSDPLAIQHRNKKNKKNQKKRTLLSKVGIFFVAVLLVILMVFIMKTYLGINF